MVNDTASPLTTPTPSTSIGVDNQGNTHIAWMDGRDYGFEKDVNYEIYYTKLRLQGAGAWDGRGRPLHLCHQEDQRHADFKR